VDWQIVYNFGGALVAGYLLYLLKRSDAKRDKQIEDFIQFRLEVAKEYVTHADLREIRDTLIRIEARLNAQADKH
jgi:hypothetical protein